MDIKQEVIKTKSKSEVTLGVLCHALVFCGLIIPLGHIFAPLVLWACKRNESAFVDQNGKESLNFQISMTLYFLLLTPLFFIVIGIPLVIILSILYLIFVIMAIIKASNHLVFRYPLTIRFIK